MPDQAMQQDEELLYNVTDGIGHIVLNRPHRRNALTFGMYDRIKEICTLAGTDADPDNVRVLIFSGGGDAAFAAGTDISQFRTFTAQDAINYEQMIDRTLTTIEECRVPTIGALNGFCTGGGAAIAATLDIRIGSNDLKIGAPIARTLGNCLAIGNLSRFVRLVGEARVKYMLLTAQLIDAEEAASAGFISECLDDRESVLQRANDMARGITELAPLTLDATMRGMRRLQTMTPLPDDHDLVEQCFGSADFKEGVAAFFEKRKPDWKGV
jgi:enoyl-CoA hydratase